MSCWNILGIEPSPDKKSIKKAYAVLLKNNRPDENPEGFSRLHTAYKQCLAGASDLAYEQEVSEPSIAAKSDNHVDSLIDTPPSEPEELALETSCAENDSPDAHYKSSGSEIAHSDHDMNHQASEEPVVVRDQLHDHDVDDSHNNTVAHPNIDDSVYVEKDVFIDALEVSWKKIVEDTDQALDALVHQDDVQAWGFLELCSELYDFEFKDNYQRYLFECLLTFFGKQPIVPDKRLKVLTRLDEVFRWSDRHFEYEEYYCANSQNENHPTEYTADTVTDVFHVLLAEPTQQQKLKWFVKRYHEGPIEQGNYYARMAATFIDIVVICIVMFTLSLIHI